MKPVYFGLALVAVLVALMAVATATGYVPATGFGTGAHEQRFGLAFGLAVGLLAGMMLGMRAK